MKPLYLLVDGRENHNTPQTESTEGVSSPCLAELKIPRPCCCEKLFLGPVSAGGAGRLGREAEHPWAAGTAASRAGERSPECQPNLEKVIWIVVGKRHKACNVISILLAAF